jgi:hypothetical protein
MRTSFAMQADQRKLPRAMRLLEQAALIEFLAIKGAMRFALF